MEEKNWYVLLHEWMDQFYSEDRDDFIPKGAVMPHEEEGQK